MENSNLETGNMIERMEKIRALMNGGALFLIPVDDQGSRRKTRLDEKTTALIAFTSREELDKGQSTDAVSVKISDFLAEVMENEAVAGVVVNPWDDYFFLEKNLIKGILEVNKAKRAEE